MTGGSLRPQRGLIPVSETMNTQELDLLRDFTRDLIRALKRKDVKVADIYLNRREWIVHVKAEGPEGRFRTMIYGPAVVSSTDLEREDLLGWYIQLITDMTGGKR